MELTTSFAKLEFDSLFDQKKDPPAAPAASAPPVSKSIIVENCKCPKCRRLGLTVWDDGSHECRYRTCGYLQVWSRVKLPLEVIREIDPDYDTEVYRTEIRKALAHVRRNMYGEEGQKNLQDLTQIVDFEIWKSVKRYSKKMNAKLAYTIAENQAQRFVKQLIEEPAGLQEFPRDAAGKALPAIPLSFQDQQSTVDGEELAESEAEIAVTASYNTPDEQLDFETEFESHRPALEALVRTWYGDKRRVGEALLKDLATPVRAIPGVSKSSAQRVRKWVWEQFKLLIIKEIKK